MKRGLLTAVLLLVFSAFHVYSLGKITDEAGRFPKSEDTSFVIPSPILRITALEFDGLASDFMFLKALVFVGGALERTEKPIIKEWEWKWLYHVLDASAGLDPYFLDPYYFANANLTWGGGLIRETNHLLEKGSRHRDWDWMLPFYIGFNNFYFLQENEVAAKYLMDASRRPGGYPMLASLAARLAYKDKRTENSIIFLEEILERTEDSVLRKVYGTRLEALRSVLLLEKAVTAFRERFRRAPVNVSELIKKGLMKELPRDPYGGTYYLDPQGVVRSTRDDKLEPFKPSSPR